MRVELAILTLGIGAGFAAGWFLTPAPFVAPRAPAVAPGFVHAGIEAGEMRRRLEVFAPAPQVSESEVPPAPDIAIVFRRELTAIEDNGVSPLVWVIDAGWSQQRRALRIGDVYRDGWRVSAISAQRVQLQRRREIRSVEAFALPVIEP